MTDDKNEKMQQRAKFLFSKEMIEECARAEERVACKICKRVVLCGKVECNNSPCELKERKLNEV